MSNDYYKKKLYPSNLGGTNINEPSYFNVPKYTEKANRESFYAYLKTGPKHKKAFIHKDKWSGKEYKFIATQHKNKEYRLTETSEYLIQDIKARPNDWIIVEKITSNKEVQYIMEVTRDGEPINNHVEEKKKKEKINVRRYF